MGSKEERSMSRREMVALGSAFGLMGLAAAGTGGALFKYMIPVVSYGTPQKFLVPIDDLPDVGDELIFDVPRVVARLRSREHEESFQALADKVGGQPAPKTLPWLAIKKVPGNQIEIDTGTSLPENSFFAI